MLTSAALLTTACTSADFDPIDDNAATLGGDRQTQIETAVTDAMQWSRSTQAAIGVWSADGEYVQAFGAEGEDTIDGNALFRGAQTTQPMLCALLLDLVADGTLELDREVAQDLPRETGIGNVTYRQLCDGTAGLADFKKPYADLYITNPTRNWSSGEKLAEALIRPTLSWPGLDVHRSDSAAVLLGKALGVVGDASLRTMFEERVFIPAEMYSSTYPDAETLTIDSSNAMTGISYPPGPQCDADPLVYEEQSPSILGAAGATITNVGDIKRFYEHYLGGTYGGSDASVITETKPTKNPKRNEEGAPTEEVDESGTQRGFGIFKQGPLWGFDGQLPGSITSAWHNPDTGFTVVVALNNSSAGQSFATNLAKHVAAVMGEAGEAWTAEDMTAKLQEAAICQEAPADEETE